MTDYRGQIETAVRAVRIVSATSFSWYGVRSPSPPRRLRPLFTYEVARSHLLAGLTDRLYEDFYCPGGARPSPRRDAQLRSAALGGRLAQAMSRANTGRGTWENGWLVRATEDGLLAVRRDGLELWVRPADCRTQPGDTLQEEQPLEPGTPVAVRLPAESWEMSPGYYCALGDAPFGWDGQDILVRVYLNLRPEQAPQAVAALTGRLNRAAVPFRLKLLRDEHRYARCDTAVLYLRGQDMASAQGPLGDAVAELASALRPGVPALTRQLATGVGLAEDPGTAGESYGQHRCRLIAEGLVQAHEASTSAHEARLAAVLEVLAAHGVDLGRPYLQPGSVDTYALAVTTPGAARPAGSNGLRGAPPADQDSQPLGPAELVAVAAGIGRRLTDEAVWHERHCTWLGPVVTVDDQGAMALAYGTTGTTLYDGDGGVALFLAVLGAVTGRMEATQTARAACWRALGMVDAAPSTTPGLYSGTVGVALAAAAVATLGDDPELAAAARRLVETATPADWAKAGFDLLSGAAGVVVGLLTLAALWDDDNLVDHAADAGTWLLDSADRSSSGWSWPDAVGAHLTGLSHGAAGAGYALLELANATGDPSWSAAAIQAFRYEQHWFAPEVGNWPDLRDHPGRRAAQTARSFLSQWCHGAPGIALSRIRAAELTGDRGLRQQAAVALGTTARDTRAAFGAGSLGYSLCHGLAGNADVLVEGLPYLDDEDASARGLIGEIARTGADRHAAGTEPWPCGIPVPGQETPGLLLGLAGIGYHYLRLADPDAIPSVLLLRPDRFARAIAALARRTRPVHPPAQPLVCSTAAPRAAG